MSKYVISLVFICWSIFLGTALAVEIEPRFVDIVPPKGRLAQDVYIKTCATCHIVIPPEVLPTESWKKILENPDNHYGKKLPPIDSISRTLMWEYLRTYSRPTAKGEPVPFLVTQARYFKALHPQVDLPKPTSHQTCITCHPGIKEYDYRSLSSEWEGK